MLPCLLKMTFEQLNMNQSSKSYYFFSSIKICTFCINLPFIYSFFWIDQQQRQRKRENYGTYIHGQVSDCLCLHISTPSLWAKKSALLCRNSSAEMTKALRVRSLNPEVQWVSGRETEVGQHEQRLEHLRMDELSTLYSSTSCPPGSAALWGWDCLPLQIACLGSGQRPPARRCEEVCP